MAAKKQPRTRHDMTTEIHIPLRELPDRKGGRYFIAAEMLTQDLAVNLPDFVILVLPGTAEKRPELILRVRDDLEDDDPAHLQ